MKKTTLLGMLLLGIATVAQAATPTVTLGITTSGNTWSLYGMETSSCVGLSSFDVSFGGGGAGMGQVLTSSLQAPFSQGRGFSGSSGTIRGGLVSYLYGIQTTVWHSTGDFSDYVKSEQVIPWVGFAGFSGPVLLAQGTFTGPAEFRAGKALGNVLSGTWLESMGPGNCQGANFVFQSGGSFPFPTGTGPSLFYGPCDANCDGVVDFHDYIAMESGFGKTGVGQATGDFTGDGRVNYDDYIQLELYFGTSSSITCDYTSNTGHARPGTPYPAICDLNQNGLVSIDDYLIMERCFGKSDATSVSEADLNGDGKVDGADWDICNGHGGDPIPVPEPATMILLAAGGTCLLRRK